MATGSQIDTDILSDEIFDVLCSMCKNKGKHTEGEKFCVDCHDYFCRTCVQVHNEVPVLVGHKVLDKSQVKSGSSKSLPRAPTERCDRHSHKHIDMYCQNHDNVGCSTCMAVDHRVCRDTFYIPEFIKNNTYQVTSGGIQTKLKNIAKTFNKQADRLKQDKQRLLNRKSELLAAIRKFRQEINDHLDKLEKSSIDEIEDKVKSLEDKIEDCLKQLQANKSRITSANDKLTSTDTNQSEVFVYVKMAEDAANVANNYMEHAKMKCTVEDIEFQPDRTIFTQLKHKNTLGTLTEKPTKTAAKIKCTEEDIEFQPDRTIFTQLEHKNTLGTLTENPTKTAAKIKSTEEDIEFQPDRTIFTQLEHKNTMGTLTEKPTKTAVKLFQIKGNKSYNVKVRSDINSCNINSACCMEDGTIILADNHNSKLKRLHSYNYTVTDYCDLPSNPKQVCMINSRQVAVSSQNEVHFISLETQMKTTNKIKTDFNCYGLAYANKNLYISDKETSVNMYTLSGRKLKQFSKDQSGHTLFSYIQSIAVSKDATRIYITDYDNGLIVLGNNGQVITSFNDEQLKGAECCYLTEAGSLLVSGYWSGNVLQFTSDGELIGEVIRGDIRSVCCNQQMTKMCTCSDDIEVYDI